MAHSRMVATLALTLAAGCGTTEQGAADGAIVVDGGMVDAAVADLGNSFGDGGSVQPSEGLTRLSGVGLGKSSGLATLGDELFVATLQGLFHGSAPDYDLSLVTSIGDEPTISVTSVAVFGDDVFVAVVGRGVLRSSDRGVSWHVVEFDTPPEAMYHAELAASTTRLALATGGAPFLWNAAAERFERLATRTTEAHDIDDPAFEGAVEISHLAFDGDLLVGDSSGYPEQGAYVLDLVARATEWRLVEGLEEWGYAMFAFDGLRGVTANANRIFVRNAEGWASVFGDEEGSQPGRAALAKNGEFLVAGADALRRSTDGTAWTTVLAAPTSTRSSLLQQGERTLWAADALRSSPDFGQSWTTHPLADIAVPTGLSVLGGHVVARFEDPSGTKVVRIDPSSSAGAPSAAAAEFAVTSTIECSATDTIVCRTGGEAGTALYVDPVELAGRPRLYAAGDRVFAAANVASAFGYTCRLYRADVVDDRVTWTTVENGLPVLELCAAPISTMTDAGALVFATVRSGAVYRSVDFGHSWSIVDGAAGFRSTAACGDRIVAIDGSSALFSSDNEGVSFAPVAFGSGSAVDVVAFEAGCVVGTRRFDAEPTLYYSTNGATFEPLMESFSAAVTDLASDASTLAIATSTHGLYRFVGGN